jgi:hypothetical protein
MTSNRRTTRRARLGAGGICMAAAAAAMIGVGTAHADTPDDVIGQADQDLIQAVDALQQAPTAGLDSQELSIITGQESQLYNMEGLLTNLESQQDGLPVADQAGLADVDQGLLNADQQMLDGVQAFVSADQAGDLATSSGALTANLDLLDPALATLGPLYDTLFDSIGAQLFSDFGLPDIFLP